MSTRPDIANLQKLNVKITPWITFVKVFWGFGFTPTSRRWRNQRMPATCCNSLQVLQTRYQPTTNWRTATHLIDARKIQWNSCHIPDPYLLFDVSNNPASFGGVPRMGQLRSGAKSPSSGQSFAFSFNLRFQSCYLLNQWDLCDRPSTRASAGPGLGWNRNDGATIFLLLRDGAFPTQSSCKDWITSSPECSDQPIKP